jgi:hypothetical protein
MKRDPKFKSLVISVALSAFLSGCGSSSGTKVNDQDKTPPSESISGKAIDGYLVNSTVCLDLNSDGYCQPSEPFTITDKNGAFELSISPEIQKDKNYAKAMLLVYGGYDIDLGKGNDFVGKLLSPKDKKEINITPITTIVAKAVQEELKKEGNKKLSVDEIRKKVERKKEEVANALGLEKDDIDKDPIKLKETKPKLIKETLKIQKALEAIATVDSGDTQNQDKSDKIEEFYEKLAQKISDVSKDNDSDKGAEKLLEKTFENSQELQRVKKITKNIDTLIDEKLDLHKVAFIAKEDIKKIGKNLDIEEIDSAKAKELKDRGEEEWKREFIRSDLEDIGLEQNISDDDLNKLIEKVDVDRPGDIFEKIVKVEDDSDEFLKEIKKRVVIKEETKEREKAKKEAIKTDKILKLKEGQKIYWIDTYQDYGNINIEMGEVVFNKNKINFQDYDFQNGSFQKDNDNDADYNLVEGKWVKETNEISYQTNSDNSLMIKDENLKVELVKVDDAKSFVMPHLNLKVDLPEGSKEYLLRFTRVKDNYKLDHKIAENLTLDQYLQQNSERSKRENWKIVEVEGKKIIEIKREDREFKDDIIAEMNGDIYKGRVKRKGRVEIEINYNETAANAIKTAIINAWENSMPNTATQNPKNSIDHDNNNTDNQDTINEDNNQSNLTSPPSSGNVGNGNNVENNTTIANEFIPFELSEPLYWAEADPTNLDIEYGEIKFVNGKIEFKEYEFDLNSGEFVEDNDDDDLILKDGNWIKEENLTYKVNSDNTIDLEPIGLKVGLVEAKDATNVDFPILGNVTLSKNPVSKLYTVQFKQLRDKYTLEEKYKDSNLSEYILSQCNTQQFMGINEQNCDLTTKEGITNNGYKWRVDKVDGKDILIVDKGYKLKIFANYNGSLYKGRLRPKGAIKTEQNYNKAALDSIKEGFKLLWEKNALSTAQESNQNSSQTDMNQSTDNETDSSSQVTKPNLLALFADKNFYLLEIDYDTNKASYEIKKIHFDENGVFEEKIEENVTHKLIVDSANNRIEDVTIYQSERGSSFDYYQGENDSFIDMGKIYYKSYEAAQKEGEDIIAKYNESRAKYTEIENNFIGSFIYFNGGMEIAFFEEIALTEFGERKFEGDWSIDGNLLTITDNQSGESISFSFLDKSELTKPSDLKNGDRVVYKIVSQDKETKLEEGNLTVDYIGH